MSALNNLKAKYPIHDLYITELSYSENKAGRRLQILSQSDHLIRRFGQLSFLILKPMGILSTERNPAADEIWALVEGQAIFHWHDTREDSPTLGEKFSQRYNSPTGVLVPFGVTFSFEVEAEGTMIIRISSEELPTDDSFFSISN